MTDRRPKSTENSRQYRRSLEAVLSDTDTRIFLWRLIVEDCRVFQEEFPISAQAYCLLAKQEIGKRLLADAKAVDTALVVKAEAEYNAMMDKSHREEKEEDIL